MVNEDIQKIVIMERENGTFKCIPSSKLFIKI